MTMHYNDQIRWDKRSRNSLISWLSKFYSWLTWWATVLNCTRIVNTDYANIHHPSLWKVNDYLWYIFYLQSPSFWSCKRHLLGDTSQTRCITAKAFWLITLGSASVVSSHLNLVQPAWKAGVLIQQPFNKESGPTRDAAMSVVLHRQTTEARASI